MARKIILSALALVMAASVAIAAPPKKDDFTTKRRTLYVTVEQDQIRFEAPKGMCFADATKRNEAQLVRLVAGLLRKKGDEQLLGLFMPCDSLANPMHVSAREGRVPSFGIITWPHDIEDAASHDSAGAYLDYREASFREYVAVNLPAWLAAADPLRQPGDKVKLPEPDGELRRGTHGLVTAYSQYVSADNYPFPTTGAVATALLRGHPVEILVRLNAASGIVTTGQAHDFMKDFIDLQGEINR